jgi:archaellum biogenesis ATPase FlaH
MTSVLVTTSVENLQNGINSVIKTFGDEIGVYVSLNKTHEGVETALEKAKISTNRLFFVDCVSSEDNKEPDVIYVKPSDLEKLTFVIKTFIEEIKPKKYLLIDSLATLLIYNNTDKVAQFVKTITDIASQKKVELIALSQKTTGEELLDKIFNFFDKVDKK